MNIQFLISGDTLNFATTVSAYSAAAGWVLKYRLVPRSSANPAITFSASAEGDDHRVTISATTTSGWAVDNYTWSSWVEMGSEVYSVDDGQIVIKPNPRNVAAGYDGRSLARKALDDCRAAFATWSSTKGTTRRYRIGEREMEFNSSAEIIAQISYWEAEVNREDMAAGRRPAFSGRILTRL